MFHAQSLRPDPLLRDFIDNYFFIQTSFQEEYVRNDILPHVYQNMSFNLGGEDMVYDIRNQEYVAPNIVAGPADSVCSLCVRKGMKRVIVNLKPGAWFQLFGIPARNFINRSENLENLIGKEITEFSRQLKAAELISRQVELLNVFFLGCLSHKRKNKAGNIEEALRQIYLSKGNIAIKQLSRSAFITSRTLERYFLEQTGLFPKMFARIVRFSEVVKDLERVSRVDWNAWVGRWGYYDQSHFINEFQFFAGCPPGRYPRAVAGLWP